MTTIVIAFGVFIAVLGAVGVVRPSVLMGMITSLWQSRRALTIAVAFRLFFGAVLVLAAEECRFPLAIRSTCARLSRWSRTKPVFCPRLGSTSKMIPFSRQVRVSVIGSP